jgi:hypothetical protein
MQIQNRVFPSMPQLKFNIPHIPQKSSLFPTCHDPNFLSPHTLLDG